MTKVDLEGVHRVATRKGAKTYVYYYAWRGGPRLTASPGSQAFVDELAAKRTEHKIGDTSRIAGLCAEWKLSDQWMKPPAEGGLAETTKKNWRPWLDRIQGHFGKLRIKHFADPEIRQDIKRWRNRWKTTPRAADMGKQVLSALLSYAVEEGKLSTNPCFGIANLYANDRSEIVWTEDDIMRLAGAASPELMYALGLACLTGLRQSDLLKLSWSHVGELAIEMRTGKSGEQRTAVIPMYAELRALLDAIPQRATTVLTNTEGRPWRSGFSSSWNKALIAAGEETLHFHDARGTFATMAVELDVFSVREIAELLGWSEDKVERIINRYVRRDALLRDKIRRMDEARGNAERTSGVKPGVKPSASDGAK